MLKTTQGKREKWQKEFARDLKKKKRNKILNNKHPDQAARHILSHRAEQLIPHLSCTPGLCLHMNRFTGRHPLVGYGGRAAGGEELIG